MPELTHDDALLMCHPQGRLDEWDEAVQFATGHPPTHDCIDCNTRRSQVHLNAVSVSVEDRFDWVDQFRDLRRRCVQIDFTSRFAVGNPIPWDRVVFVLDIACGCRLSVFVPKADLWALTPEQNLRRIEGRFAQMRIGHSTPSCYRTGEADA